MILFATFFQLLAVMAYFGYYESIMTTSGMSTAQVTQALLVYPITAALFSLPAGYIADKFGRKPAAILFAVLAFVGLIAFILSAGAQVNPYIVGLIYGIELGASGILAVKWGLCSMKPSQPKSGPRRPQPKVSCLWSSQYCRLFSSRSWLVLST